MNRKQSVNMEDTLKFINDVIAEYNERMKSQPYQINLLEEVHMHEEDGSDEQLRMMENAHSRILRSIFAFRNKGEYVLLRSFINYLAYIYHNSSWNDLHITQPKEPENEHATNDGRIDLFVEEPGNYAIIFENKINLSEQGDQQNQLARYILDLHNCGYREDQIFVVYLTSDGHNPSEQSWTDPNDDSNCFRERFQSRYANLSFNGQLLDWLKNHAIPIVKELEKERILDSALVQYVNYLEIKYKQRDIDFMKTSVLRQALGFTNTQTNTEQLSVVYSRFKSIMEVQMSMTELIKELLQNKYSNLQEVYNCLSIVDNGQYDQIRCDNDNIEVAFSFSFNSNTYYVLLYRHSREKNLHCGVFPRSSQCITRDIRDQFSQLSYLKNDGTRLYSKPLNGYFDEVIDQVLSRANQIASQQ
jgi:hypothetical protein